MQAACDTAFNYAHERKQFNTKIGEFQLIQAKVNKSFSWPRNGRFEAIGSPYGILSWLDNILWTDGWTCFIVQD